MPVTEVFVLVPPTITWARPVSSGSMAAASGTAPGRLERGHVVEGQGRRPAACAADEAGRDAARGDEDEVRAQALEGVRDRRLGAFADRHHADDRGHADQDAEDGQGGAELVRGGRHEGGPERLVDRHVSRPSCGRRGARGLGRAPAPRTANGSNGEGSWPRAPGSRRSGRRGRSARRAGGSGAAARSATRGSWVTTITVRPLSWRRPNRRMIAAPVAESRLPVGSSASRIAGWVTSARAIATRCCSPPDSWFGRWPCPGREADGLEGRQGLAPAVGVPAVGERQRDVVDGGRPGEQVPLLEDEAHVPVADVRQGIVAEARHVDAGEDVLARGRRRRGSPGCS